WVVASSAMAFTPFSQYSPRRLRFSGSGQAHPVQSMPPSWFSRLRIFSPSSTPVSSTKWPRELVMAGRPAAQVLRSVRVSPVCFSGGSSAIFRSLRGAVAGPGMVGSMCAMGWDHELAKGTRPPRAGIFSAMTARRTTALLIALTALALLVRTALALHHHALGWHTADDAGMYLTLAAHLPHGVFSMFHPLDIPDTIKRPGYPALIHLLGSDLLTVLLVQALLAALKVPMVFLAGRAVGLHSPWALGAAALMAIEPVDALLAAQFLSETLFGTLFLGGV